jgi:hypothetical protein
VGLTKRRIEVATSGTKQIDASERISQIRDSVSAVYDIDQDSLKLSTKNLVTSPANPGNQPAFATLSTSLVNDLEAIEFAGTSADPAIRDRLIEQNVDDAIRYLQVCMALRSEFSGIAKNYVDTRLKTEEFFRLDAVARFSKTSAAPAFR